MKKLLKSLFSQGKKRTVKKLSTEKLDIHPRTSVVDSIIEANDSYLKALFGITENNNR